MCLIFGPRPKCASTHSKSKHLGGFSFALVYYTTYVRPAPPHASLVVWDGPFVMRGACRFCVLFDFFNRTDGCDMMNCSTTTKLLAERPHGMGVSALRVVYSGPRPCVAPTHCKSARFFDHIWLKIVTHRAREPPHRPQCYFKTVTCRARAILHDFAHQLLYKDALTLSNKPPS